jgi:predicted DNA-binding protein YlxM (UPF0122 family)
MITTRISCTNFQNITLGYVWELTHVLLEIWHTFVWKLTHVLMFWELTNWIWFESLCILNIYFYFDISFSQLSNKTWVNSQAKHESIFKQNMSQLTNKIRVNSQAKHESTLKQNMSQLSSKTWVNFLFCLRVDSCFVCELTHVLLESWLVFCLWVDSCFVWELTHVLFESWQQNMSQLSSKTWVNFQTKHESTL